MELWWVLALAAAGFVAATSNAAVGIGGGLLVMPLLSLWFPPRLAVAYTIPMFFASTLVIAWRYRGQVDRRFLAWLVPGVFIRCAVKLRRSGRRYKALAPQGSIRGFLLFNVWPND
ncbi:MAG: sulfite exporter TauE/SafE family protein [Thermaerobacter sp.]|nr:sulfite exporter TauE/SafE family protein [Thermaerobacter sp.]